jgi:hypothetical protein
MKVEPIAVAPAGATTFELEPWDGRVRSVARGARHGWRVNLGARSADVLLPTTGCRDALRGPRVQIGEQLVRVPRGFGRRATKPVDIDGHSLRFETWFAGEPMRRYRRRVKRGRVGLAALLGSLLSPGVGGGMAAASTPERRMRFGFQLLVDGEVAGTWLSTTSDSGRWWEHFSRAADVDGAAADWDRSIAITYRGEPSIETTDDDELAQNLVRLLAGGAGGAMELMPPRRRAFSVQLEWPDGSDPTVSARIPFGSGPGRRVLLEHGWVLQRVRDTATRYYARTFAPITSPDALAVLGELRAAYGYVYGSAFQFDRWQASSYITRTELVSM